MGSGDLNSSTQSLCIRQQAQPLDDLSNCLYFLGQTYLISYLRIYVHVHSCVQLLAFAYIHGVQKRVLNIQ